jgi:hypothetical protein
MPSRHEEGIALVEAIGIRAAEVDVGTIRGSIRPGPDVVRDAVCCHAHAWARSALSYRVVPTDAAAREAHVVPDAIAAVYTVTAGVLIINLL